MIVTQNRSAFSARRALPAVALLALLPTLVLGDDEIRFNRDIRPILSDACFHCHGPDPGTRKAGLRLDTKEGFFAPTAKRGPAVVAGDPAKSPLWQRLITTDPDDLMPPPESHKELKPEQKAVLKKWIEQGAAWQPHWSFIKPEKTPIPSVKNVAWVRNPIDAYILAALEAKGLAPAPEADRRTLARRLSLDLTGLPPSPELVEEYVKDTRLDHYERLVDRLMDSPKWGEHRGRYWLDAARYADTHGLHFDNYREMWPYRDWVIGAFNRNVPFDRFTVEQIAGDLLPDPDDDQKIATGFHRCNITTNEGGTIEEENLANYANDRVTTTSWVWLGLTANCAACHDHKFDPISQRDFYSMAAFFRNTKQPGLDGNVKDSTPSMVVVTDEADRGRWESIPKEIETTKKEVESVKWNAAAPFERWVQDQDTTALEKTLEQGLSLKARLNEGAGTEIKVIRANAESTFPITGTNLWTDKGKLGPSLRLENGAAVEIPDSGGYDLGQPFSYGAWVFIPESFNESGAIAARMDNSKAYRGWDLWYEQGMFGTHLVNAWPDNAVKVRTKKRFKKGRWQHVMVTTDGTGKAAGIRVYVDGVSEELEKGPDALTATIRTDVPLKVGRRDSSDFLKGGSVQDLRLYDRALNAGEVRSLASLETLKHLAGNPVASWDKTERAEAFENFLTSYVPYQEKTGRVAALEKEREAIRQKYPVTHIQIEKTDSMPMANILFRGQYDQKKDQVVAAVFGALNPMPAGAPTNRLGLAQWLISPENPLVSRVTVNRFWSELFGTGLVKTSEDLGIMGDLPSNQELLDWLAVDFREGGWDVKRFFKQVVMSSAYRQAATTTPEKLDKDPANRLISRGPRFRMDAEMVRDYALAAGGLLVEKVGGPSVKPYQPDGVWEPVAMPESNTKKYQRDTGEGLYRRSMYTFWKRAAPPASMDVFNAPSRETCTVRRERTNTPLQALATMNDPQFVEAARKLAEAALRGGKDDMDRTLDIMARRILSRPLTSEETGVVKAGLKELTEFYTANPPEAKRLLEVGESKTGSTTGTTTLAAYTMVANQLMNLDEVLNK
jgi:hypothetical protein